MMTDMHNLPLPEGPWTSEPDREEFRSPDGYACLLNRNHMGAWCGYVGLPPGHPWHGKHALDHIVVHGGVNYSAPCHGEICHTPGPGESDKVWWLGFDCGHAWDIMPRELAIHEHIRKAAEASGDVVTAKLFGREPPFSEFAPRMVYRTIDYARDQTLLLAVQAAAAMVRHVRKLARSRRQARKSSRGYA